MPFLHHLQPWLAPLATAGAAMFAAAARVAWFQRRLPVLREDDLSDWLLADIGWRDGRDTGARRMGRQCDRPPRALL